MSNFTILLSLQKIAGLLSLAGALIVVAVVVFLLISATKEEDKTTAKEKVYKLRGRYLWGIIVMAIVLLFISFKSLPYSHSKEKAAEEVTVVGYQWLWKMDKGVYNAKLEDFGGKNEIELPVNKSIKFIVTSTDVNHNFAIYNSAGVLVTQTQAMPQHKNILQYTFKEKGEYQILCLEYCGTAHDFMVGIIHIN
ncbi:MAG: hypothetical protein KF781_02390 [Chitinophagaceae bacterium]|nr:hypothetical protein [Chitinophagaceae bacterium]MCW5904358.1 hypothetical protein [Chitinophagaceae bacterium]